MGTESLPHSLNAVLGVFKRHFSVAGMNLQKRREEIDRWRVKTEADDAFYGVGGSERGPVRGIIFLRCKKKRYEVCTKGQSRFEALCGGL